MARQTYVFRDGKLIEKKTGEACNPVKDGKVYAPLVWRDIPEYRSPIDGKIISSRSARREDLKANGCVEYDGPRRRPFKNAAWCKKRNIPFNQE